MVQDPVSVRGLCMLPRDKQNSLCEDWEGCGVRLPGFISIMGKWREVGREVLNSVLPACARKHALSIV